MEEVKNDQHERRKMKSEEWKKQWTENAPQRRRKRGIFGMVLVLFGTWWLLRRMDIVDMPYWVFTWPVLLIGIGLISLLANGFRGAGGYVLVFIGSVFLLKNEFGIPPNFELYFWPVMMIIIGLIIIFKPNRHRYWKKKRWNSAGSHEFEINDFSTDDSDRLEAFVIFGAARKDIISKNFKGGEVTCVMGGTELHMSKADIKSTANLDLTVVMGGLKLIVPPHWNVIVKSTNILGGIDDKRRHDYSGTNEEPKTLILDGTVIMGGIEIKSY